MARFGLRADRAANFRPGPGRANLQAQNRAKMGRRALTGPWKTGPGRAKTGRATARHKPSSALQGFKGGIPHIFLVHVKTNNFFLFAFFLIKIVPLFLLQYKFQDKML